MAHRTLHVTHVVCTDSFAGAERAVTISAAAIAARGHRVTVIGGDPEAMRAELAPVGIHHHPARSVARAARALRSVGRADVVHAHMTAAEAAVLASLRWRTAHFVVTRHFALPRGTSALGLGVRAAMRRVPHTEIAISRFVASSIEESSVIVPFGLPERPAVPLDAKTVVVIQRLEAEKDTATVLRAWSTARLHEEGWELRIAGAGAERSRLEAMASDLGIASSVRFLGRVADVDALRASASLQLTTATSEHFGLSVLEAMAVGLPVVASASGAHPELLSDLGGWFAAGDADACAAALRRAAGDTSWRRATGAALRARQQEHFSLAEHGRRLEEIYRHRPTGNVHSSD